MKFSAHVVFLSLSIGLLPLCAHAVPVGMAANVKGNVSVIEGDKKTPLRLLGRVEPGATIACGPNSSAVIVLFKNGSRFQIGANQRAKISASSLEGGKRLAAMSGPSNEAVALLGGSRVGAIMARPPASFARTTGDAPPYLDSPTPNFKWLAQPNAKRYTFTLFDNNDNIIWATYTSDTSAAYPADAPPLLEKCPYVWKVTGFGESGKPLKSVWGIVTRLSTQDTNELNAIADKLKAEYATTHDETSLLLLAETYLYYGVYNSALELLTGPDFDQSRPDIEDAVNRIEDSMSPFARVLAKRPYTPPQEPAF